MEVMMPITRSSKKRRRERRATRRDTDFEYDDVDVVDIDVDENDDEWRTSSEKRNRRKQRRICKDDDVVDDDESSNRGKGWPDLPNDLLEPIMGRLFFADQISFRAVCKSWHSVDRVFVPEPIKQMPWLIVFDDIEGKHSWDSCKLVDPTYKKTYKVDMSFINKKKNLKDCRVKIHESKYGWLLMSCVPNQNQNQNKTSNNHLLFLYTPFIGNAADNNIIDLPVLSCGTDFIATFDLSPTTKKKNGEDFQVLILSSVEDQTCIRTCRRGDNSWSCKKPDWKIKICDIKCWLYSEGIFYHANHSGRRVSGCYDVVRKNWKEFPTVPSTRSRMDSYMIKFEGEIYLILMNRTRRTWGIIYVSVYKLDLSKGIWEPIDNLGDRALFVGDGYSSILKVDTDVEELKNVKQVYCCYESVLKQCDSLKDARSHVCSYHYGPLAQAKQDFRRLWIDPPLTINSL